MAKKEKTKIEKMPKNYSLTKAYRQDKWYKNNVVRRDKDARKYIAENCSGGTWRDMLPGQLVMFDYFEPKTKEELEYYDAMPCTIFFNHVKTKDGNVRVLGFNLHYLPPYMRKNVLNKIMETFQNIYAKSWNSGIKSEISYFDYNMLVYLLQKAKLNFAVRMYIPELIQDIYVIPPKDFVKACFTEGHFKKQTRAAILEHWKNLKIDKSLNKRATKAGKKLED